MWRPFRHENPPLELLDAAAIRKRHCMVTAPSPARAVFAKSWRGPAPLNDIDIVGRTAGLGNIRMQQERPKPLAASVGLAR